MTKYGKQVVKLLIVVMIFILLISTYFMRRNAIITPSGGVIAVFPYKIEGNDKIKINIFDEREIRGLSIAWDNQEWIEIDTRQVSKLEGSIRKPDNQGIHKLKIKIGMLRSIYFYTHL